MPNSEMMPYTPFMPLVMVIAAIIIIIPFWTIFKRVGHSKWLGILMTIPVVNIFTLYYLAFSEWPNLPKIK
jgi:hypothetical protein